MLSLVASVLPTATHDSSLSDAGAYAAITAAAVAVLLLIAGVARWVYSRLTRPNLVMEFDLGDTECVQDRAAHPNRDLQLRIRVTNTGRSDAMNVRLRLFERDPKGHDHYLRVRHDSESPYANSTAGVDAPGSGTKPIYFDLLFAQHGRDNMVFQYADAYLLQEQLQVPVLRGRHVFTLEMQSRELNGRSMKPKRERWAVDENLNLTKIGARP